MSGTELERRRLEVLKIAVPRHNKVMILRDPSTGSMGLSEVKIGAPFLGLELFVVETSDDAKLAETFAGVAAQGINGEVTNTSGDVMRFLATILLALISFPTWANELDSLLQQAQVLGAPMAAVQRAIQISRQPIFPKKDVLAVFDISQPSANKRFYVLDFKSAQVTAHYAAHGRDNGPNARAIKFKGFQTDMDMVPLGPLKTAHSEVMDHYKTIVDRYDGTVYRNMIVVVLEGVTSYNSYINHTPPLKWIIHPNWYTTAAFRAKNNGVLGRSNGCITVDPVENNRLVTRLRDGALVYVTVGDAPIEQYL